MRFILLLLIALVELSSEPAQAEIYRYIDEKGHSVYVDNLALIPAQHRQKAIDEQTEKDQPTALTANNKLQDSTDWDSRWQHVITDSQLVSPAQQAQTTPVQIINNQVIVPVQIKLKRKKVQLKLLLDTGASVTLLHQHSIKNLNLGKTQSQRAKIADGSTVEIKVVAMTELLVGPIRMQETPVAIIDLKSKRQQIDGLLGLDVLRHHPFKIDYQKQLIIWQ